MKHIQIFLVAGSVALSVGHSTARTFYVSGSGSDSHSIDQAQHSQTAWRTLDKVNSVTFLPGDSLLFKRGEVFFGQLIIRSSGKESRPIFVGGYSVGAAPVISGAFRISSWKRSSGSIYSAPTQEEIFGVFCNGVEQIPTRFPVSGLRTIGAEEVRNELHDQALEEADNYWKGGTVHIRTSRWTFEKRIISASHKGVLQFASPLEYAAASGWGYFIDGGLLSPDAAREWSFNSNTKTLFFWPPQTQDPNSLDVEGSIADYGIRFLNCSNVIVSGLKIFGQRVDGIRIDNSEQITLSDICLENALTNGIHIASGSGLKLLDDTIRNANSCGILANKMQNSMITGTSLTNIGCIPGFAVSGNDAAIGIMMYDSSSSNILEHNNIDSTGYGGISCYGPDNTIRMNEVSNTCLVLDDGGAIYVWGEKSKGTVVDHNIVENSLGSSQGTPYGTTAAEGIYLDDRSYGISVSGNTVVNADDGIYLHNSMNDVIDSNTCYGNREAQLSIECNLPDKLRSQIPNRILSNILCSCNENQFCVKMETESEASSVAEFSSNSYYNPFVDNVVLVIQPSTGPKIYTLQKWRANYPGDSGAKGAAAWAAGKESVAVTGPELIKNGDFESGISGWNAWPGSCSIDYNKNSIFSGGCLKARFTGEPRSQTALVYSQPFQLSKGEYYQVSFSAAAIKNSSIGIDAIQAHEPYANLGLDRFFEIDNKPRRLSIIFKCTMIDPVSRIDLRIPSSDSICWIDSVSMHLVKVSSPNPDEYVKLLVNKGNSGFLMNAGAGNYRTPEGAVVSKELKVPLFHSVLLVSQ